ncbi:MAG: penicillin-binding protein 2 [Alphaproteobacteria bacterium]
MRRDNKRYRTLTRRTLLLGAAQAGLFGVLASRMYYLQVVEGSRYAALADDNRISPRLVAPTRGLIFDRFGVPLAVNQKTWRVTVTPERSGGLETSLDRLSQLVALSDGDRQRVLKTARRQRAFQPITVVDSLSWEDIATISVNAPDLPGIEVEMVPRRVYPYGEIAGHVVGYVGPAAREDLTGDPLLTVPEFRIGKAGIERARDVALRGKADIREVEVNAVGRVIRELRRIEGEAGKDLTISLDVELQRFALNRLGEQTGAAVVIDVRTGDILAMASAPSHDPNAFTRGITPEEWRDLSTDERGPLSNKAISGQYAPGSTFKMIVAAAALEAGLVTPGQGVFCGGSMELGDGRFHCWRRGGHGTMNMHDAIVQSCDVYFYEVARRIGIDRIAEMSHRFGIGVRLGLELPNERTGLVPTRAWKRATLDKPWTIGETLIAGIGQGYVLATPLQLAVMTARLVNGGRAVTPRIATALTGGDGPPSPLPVSPAPPIGVSAETLQTIGRAMAAVTMSQRGTAHAARILDRDTAMGGKTGTSQVRRITMAERRTGVRRNEDLERHERDHALFVGYAPLEAPRYAVAVIVEHGGGGSAVAAPIARDLLIETQRRDPARIASAAAPPSAPPARPTEVVRR